MWLFTKNSFISVVQHRERQDHVLVRARVKKHIVRLFPGQEKLIAKDDTADYRWRLLMPKQVLADTLADYIIHRLDYDNFKAAQEADDPSWLSFLHSIWGVGLGLQKKS